MPDKKLLIAIGQDDVPLVTSIFEKDFELMLCHSFAHACAATDDSFDLIACGLHFDDGRMFDYLRHVKSDPATAHIPFFCIAGSRTVLSPAILKSIAAATSSLGAQGFINLGRWQKQHGQAQAHVMLREATHRYLANAGR